MKIKSPSCILMMLLLIFVSCSEKYEINVGESGIFAIHNASTRVVGEETLIRVFTEEGTEVTSESVIYVNGEEIQDNSFVANETGFYEVVAKYFNLESTQLFVEYQDGSQTNYRKRVLVEDYTGTWCGWCPRVAEGMKLVGDISEDIVFVAIHRAPVGTADPYNYTNAESLEQLINTPGYPKGFINRINQWEFPEPFNIDQVLAYTQGSNPRLGLALNSSVSNNKINVDVKVGFAKDFQNLKLVVQVLENGLVWPQVNYTEYYDGLNPVENYVHDYTLRTTLTDILGDEIPNAETRLDNNWVKSIAYDIPDFIEDVSQVDIVAFVVDESGEVVNVRKSSLGENQEFELQ